MLRRAERSGGLGRPECDIAFDGHPIRPLDGAEAGGYPGLAGGDGLAVAAAVGAIVLAAGMFARFARWWFVLPLRSASDICARMTASRTATRDVGACPWAEIRPHGFLATTTQ